MITSTSANDTPPPLVGPADPGVITASSIPVALRMGMGVRGPSGESSSLRSSVAAGEPAASAALAARAEGAWGAARVDGCTELMCTCRPWPWTLVLSGLDVVRMSVGREGCSRWMCTGLRSGGGGGGGDERAPIAAGELAGGDSGEPKPLTGLPSGLPVLLSYSNSATLLGETWGPPPALLTLQLTLRLVSCKGATRLPRLLPVPPAAPPMRRDKSTACPLSP